MALLRERIVGQDAVLGQVEALLKVVKADIGERERPLSVDLFMGPTGVGKTEVVRLLAQAIHGRADAFCRIDMHTLAQEHYAAALTGAPPGYVAARKAPPCSTPRLLLAASVGPASCCSMNWRRPAPRCCAACSACWRHGRLTLTAGSRTLDFRNSLIFMTSNIGAQPVQRLRERFARGWRRWLGLVPKGRRARRALTRSSIRSSSIASTASSNSKASTTTGWRRCWRSS